MADDLFDTNITDFYYNISYGCFYWVHNGLASFFKCEYYIDESYEKFEDQFRFKWPDELDAPKNHAVVDFFLHSDFRKIIKNEILSRMQSMIINNLSMSNKPKMLGNRQIVKSLINQGNWLEAIIKSHEFSENYCDRQICELKYSCIKDPYWIGLISNLSRM